MANSKPRKVYLYGELGKKFGKEHTLYVSTAAEAIRALTVIFPSFKDYLREARRENIVFKVREGKDKYLTSIEDFKDCSTKSIFITPVINGSSKQSTFQFVGAAILAVVGAVMNAYAPGSGTWAYAAAAAMFMGGVASLLIKTPEQKKAENSTSYSFGGPINTTTQGSPVPVGYGRLVVGSAVISARVTTSDIAIG